ncbi:MAG: heme lyase CcmF/NrfE family subunit [Deltaproteobacteria bacterium]|nr:heme lyase CcmF/NrfE family subunit [Deltaproteobacteria bacterium]
MNSIIGQSLIWIAMIAAFAGVLLGFVTGKNPSRTSMQWLYRLVMIFSGAMVAANVVMVTALITHDFSVSYVAKVGSRSTPLSITIVSLWSALEGSLLFWGFILALVVVAFAHIWRKNSPRHMAYAIGTILTVSLFFAIIIVGPANPFTVLSPIPFDGPGPNPLLQNHPLMIIHPPLLYCGYVAMVLPFAIAIAVLLAGETNWPWLNMLRQTMLIAWGFLGLGILTGSWWSYEILGWGGYWSWDPIENASLIPWLTATACLHAIIIQKRQKFLALLTLALAIITFLLTIFGTFITRSGIINSVHAFTQSTIGPTFLAFLGVISIASLALLSKRNVLNSSTISTTKSYTLLSKPTLLLMVIALLLTFAFTILLGTIFPLFTEFMRGVKISVGAPYFNNMSVPIVICLLIILALSYFAPFEEVKIIHPNFLLISLFISSITFILFLLTGIRPIFADFIFSLCAFAATGILLSFTYVFSINKIDSTENKNHRCWSKYFLTRFLGMQLIHLSFIIIVAAVCGSHFYKQTYEFSLTPGSNQSINNYKLTYVKASLLKEPHRQAINTKIKLEQNNKIFSFLYPSLVYYQTQREPLGVPHILTINYRDLYLSLISFNHDDNKASFKFFIIPLISWLWLTIPLIGVGTILLISFKNKSSVD